MECGHPLSLLLRSAETGEPLYCKLCDAIDGRRDAEKMEQEYKARAEKAEAALHELVWLKEMKDECLRRRQRRPQSVTRVFPQDLLDAEADYKRRKPLAWDAARAITGPVF